MDYSDGTPDVTFTYDRMGRQQQITDAAGTRAFAYNADFSLASEAISGIYTKVLSRSYDSAPGTKGRYAGFSVGAGYAVSYGYDAKGRMNNVSWNVNSVPGSTTYSYLPSSDLLSGMSTVRTDGAYTPVTASYTYEDKRDVKTQVLNKAGARVISQYDYRYNSIGNRTSAVNSGEAFGSQHPASSPENREGFNLYAYNSRSEVTESKRYRGSNLDDTSRPVTPEYRAYNYDPIGNRETAVDGNETSETGNSTTYTTNDLNQYESTAVTPNNNESATFTYDADGNMTSISDATGYTVYSFDCENRLVDVTVQSQASPVRKVTFAYDFMGRRISKSVFSWNNNAWSPVSSRTFTWDGWLMTDETATTPNSQPETTSYVWGLDLSQTLTGAGGVGGLLAMSNDAGNSFNCYLYDANGNVTQLVDINIGDLTTKYEYDAYGNTLYGSDLNTGKNIFKFSTKQYDFEIDMYYYGYRYLTTFGKWISRDPLEEQASINMYNFVNNNSINSLDMLGRDVFSGDTAYSYAMRQFKYIYSAAMESMKNAVDNSSNFVSRIAKSALCCLVKKFEKEYDMKAQNMNAIGFQAGIQFVPGFNAFIGGWNGMFFPHSCEIAQYTFINGIYKPKEWVSKLDFEKHSIKSLGAFSLRALGGGWSIGASVEYVSAIPKGISYHDSSSWEEWFYTFMGSAASPAGFGISGSKYYSSTWTGYSLGGTFSLPGLGAAYAGLYYKVIGKPVSYKNNKCLCTALRMLTSVKPDRTVELMKHYYTNKL